MTKYYFARNGSPTGRSYSIVELAEMLCDKKIRGHRLIIHVENNGVYTWMEAAAFVDLAYREIWDKSLSVRQRAYLRFLGYDGTLYISQKKGSALIEKLKADPTTQELIKDSDFETYVEAAEHESRDYETEALRRHYGGGGIFRDANKGELRSVADPKRAEKKKELEAAQKAEKEKQRQKRSEEKRIRQEERQRQWDDWKANRWPKHKENMAKTGRAVASIVGFFGKWVGKGAKAGASAIADSLCIEYEMPLRTWTSTDGKETVDARLVSVSEKFVKLQKSDGSFIDAPKVRLSPYDLKWIEENQK